MKFEISRSIYPDGKIRFIARDKDRIVRFREDTLEEIQKAIKTYKEPPPIIEGEKEEKDKGKGVSVKGEEVEKKDKKFLTNKLAEKVQKRKLVLSEPVVSVVEPVEGEEQEEQKTPETTASAKKKSFWDKLK